MATMAEELERPTISLWLWLVVGGLAVLGAFTILGWLLRAVFGLLRLALLVGVVAVAYLAVRGLFSRRG
jgi:hypothetical protein